MEPCVKAEPDSLVEMEKYWDDVAVYVGVCSFEKPKKPAATASVPTAMGSQCLRSSRGIGVVFTVGILPKLVG